jgi:hypothetical protein
MASTRRSLGFKGYLADLDVWLQPACKPDGTKYYQYVLIYVNEILVVSHDPDQVMKMLGEHYTLKKGSVKAPSEYLGAEIKAYRPDKLDSRVFWAMSCNSYVKRAMKEIQQTLDAQGEKPLPNKVGAPLVTGYRPKN